MIDTCQKLLITPPRRPVNPPGRDKLYTKGISSYLLT